MRARLRVADIGLETLYGFPWILSQEECWATSGSANAVSSADFRELCRALHESGEVSKQAACINRAGMNTSSGKKEAPTRRRPRSSSVAESHWHHRLHAPTGDTLFDGLQGMLRHAAATAARIADELAPLRLTAPRRARGIPISHPRSSEQPPAEERRTVAIRLGRIAMTETRRRRRATPYSVAQGYSHGLPDCTSRL